MRKYNGREEGPMNLTHEIQSIVYAIPGTILGITLHEFAHAVTSYALGDPTPRYDGRLSLNPLRHFEWKGTLCLILFHFGWAKPVMINPWYYKNPRVGSMLVAAAGPLMNLILSFLSLVIYTLSLLFLQGTEAGYMIGTFSQYSAFINVGLFVFNLIPIPPLDGHHILGGLFPPVRKLYSRFPQAMTVILLLIVFTGVANGPLAYIDALVIQKVWYLAAMFLNKVLPLFL